MIKISDRLMVMAILVGNLKTVADIGTDHGFLPIYLNQLEERKKIILTDISEKSLNKSKENVYFHLKNRDAVFDFRVGDGLDVLEENEVEAVCIGGMGGFLIATILAENFEIAHSLKRIILQPRNGQGKLRWWLENSGFKITANKVVMEGKVPCEIILAEQDVNCKIDKPANLENYNRLTEKEKLKYYFRKEMMYHNGTSGFHLAISNLYKDVLIYKNLKKAKERNLEKEQIQLYKIDYYKKLIKEFIDSIKVE